MDGCGINIYWGIGPAGAYVSLAGLAGTKKQNLLISRFNFFVRLSNLQSYCPKNFLLSFNYLGTHSMASCLT